jgi:hypothetical protein
MIADGIDLPGEVVSAVLVAGRRGSRVWRLVMADGQTLALKYTSDDGEAVQQQAPLLAAREAAVLRVLDPGAVYSSGITTAGSWVALTWYSGQPLGVVWRRLRGDGAGLQVRASARIATLSAADAVADLHARGWCHADLQAEHMLISDGGPARLVDVALAQGPAPIVPEVTYRGALAHVTAPEIAREVLDTPVTHHVALTAEAEVYTFGAVVFAAWAGVWPVDYGRDPRSLSVEQVHAAIVEPLSRNPMPDGWPALSGLLTDMLTPEPADRPTMAEVAATLRAADGP